jgi:hypothetical protein
MTDSASEAEQRLSVGQGDALAAMLHSHEAYRTAEHLTVAPALEELALFLEDHASGRRYPRAAAGQPTSTGDRGSLVHDVEQALLHAGAAVQETIKPPMLELRLRKLSTLAAVIQDARAATALAAEIRTMLEQLGDLEAVLAAWEDVLAAVSDDATQNAVIALRVAQLAESVELHGRSWESMKHELSLRAGRRDLDRIKALLCEPPFLDADVTWVAFGNAHLRQGYRRLGPIQFFDKRFSYDDLRNGCPELSAFDEFEPAPELTKEALDWHFARIDTSDYVLARVELTGPRAVPAGREHPIDRGRRLAAGVVEAAGFLTGGTGWVLMDGGSAFGNDRRAGSMGFADPAKLAHRRTVQFPSSELTSWGLTELPAAFADALTREDAVALRAITELEWHRATTRIPDAAMRVTQRVRVFETQWVTGSGSHFASWEDGVRHFLRDQWCWHAIQDALFAAVASIEGPHHPLYMTRQQESADALAAAFREIWTQQPDLFNTYSWRPGAVLQLAAEVAQHFLPGTIDRRRWRELDRIGRTGAAAQEWVEGRSRAFDTLLNRAVRQRNAIVHGQALVPAVIDSVEPFLDALGAGLVHRWIDAAGGGTSVEQELESSRARLRDRFSALPDEPSGFALWPAVD